MTTDNIFFTADLHLSHNNIIKYCGRPFADVRDMNVALVDNWNSVVPDNGITYVIGDFSFYHRQYFASLLNGSKIFLKGNHDGKSGKILYSLICIIDGIKVYMQHKPICVNGVDIILCGHIHNKWQSQLCGSILIVNVGVDVWDYKPVPLASLQSILANGGMK